MNFAFCDSALVLVGHGSTLNPDSSAPTHAHARAIRERGIFREVHSCFWKEEPSMREIFRMVESETIYIVPVFISEGYFTQKVIPRELELAGRQTRRGSRTIYYCDPVGSHPRMTEALLRRAREIAPRVPPEATSLFIVGHGTDLNDNSARAAKEQAARIQALGQYAQVVSAYMEEPPLIVEWDKLCNQSNVVIVPFFIADGLHSYQDIPVLLGIETEPGPAASQAEIFRRNPYELRGKKLFYASAIGTEPMIADVILDQVAASVPQDQKPVGLRTPSVARY
ncbi:MAG TPA: CbiX/SirB N-terminal domain-containing protein [Terrimicrobiaceae bacterium]